MGATTTRMRVKYGYRYIYLFPLGGVTIPVIGVSYRHTSGSHYLCGGEHDCPLYRLLYHAKGHTTTMYRRYLLTYCRVLPVTNGLHRDAPKVYTEQEIPSRFLKPKARVILDACALLRNNPHIPKVKVLAAPDNSYWYELQPADVSANGTAIPRTAVPKL